MDQIKSYSNLFINEQSSPLPGPTGDKVDDNDDDNEPPHGLKLTSSIAMTSPGTEAVFATKAICKKIGMRERAVA